ncbi:MAG: hypothetical protein ABIR59_03590 [Gemmatimonadales bacterium]
MSRAFVKEDDFEPPPRSITLPPRDDPSFDLLAAEALLESARIGETEYAELATGYPWGEPRLRPHVERIRDDAIAAGDDRLEQVADRYLAVGSRRNRGR